MTCVNITKEALLTNVILRELLRFSTIVARGPDADSVERAKHPPEKENCLRDGAPWQLSR